ncbi:retrovirus-related pol polyprotein from transposon TNT 1-94 [Tanacetum coccineum]|uniref:Retrovirus-related pol polyprotein from transposon TNT 1-94 n=1 Tax=Tanacetum coccineum TaxID=301880 RepID=A0ABQ4Y4H3_9ASTR
MGSLSQIKDEAPKVIETFLKKIEVLLQAPVIIVRIDNGTKFKNQVLKENFDSVGISYQSSSVRTPQQNGVSEAIATACYTQNCSIIHCRFDKTPYELINGRKPDISFLHLFGALCYPKNDQEDLGKLGAKGLDLTYAPSAITSQKPTEHDLDQLFEAMYDDYIGGQPSAATRTSPSAQVHQVLQTPMATTTTTDTASTPTNSFSQAADIPNSSQDVDKLEPQQQCVQQQDDQVLL